jgi:hypothetical protein
MEKQTEMNKEFIPYEQALALKAFGFDEPCITSYDTDGRLRNPFDYKNSEYTSYLSSYIEDAEHFVQNTTLNSESGFIAAPLYQQAFRWFREKYELQHEIVYDLSNDLINRVYVYTIFGTDRSEEYKTYEEAELECLKKLIEIVKNKQK